MTSDVYEEVFMVAIVIPLYLHEGRVLQQSELAGGDAPAKPGCRCLGGDQARRALLAGVDEILLEGFDTAS